LSGTHFFRQASDGRSIAPPVRAMGDPAGRIPMGTKNLMTVSPEHAAATIAVFLLTLTLILARPRGLHEAWATLIGGGLMLLLRLETPQQAWRTTAQGGDVLAFLLALMLLSALLDSSGFFEWAAILSARAAQGSGSALYRNVFLLGALITALLSLDTTAIILTPVVLAFVQRLHLKPLPFLLACAFVANTGSLLLPVSNLTNLLFQNAFHLKFGAFALRMALPQIGAVLVNFLVFRRLFRADLPDKFDPSQLPEPSSVLPDLSYFRGAVLVLACVLIGYFVGSLRGIQPSVIALAGCGALLTWGLIRRQVTFAVFREISWPLFPFVVGLFVVIQGVENLGLAAYATRGLEAVGPHPFLVILTTAFGAGLGANIVNNIPMGLLCISVLHLGHAAPPALYGALLGCNIGPNLTPAGSLATMLVITTARKKGEDISAGQFVRAGLRATPLVLLASCALLWLALSVLH